VGAWIRLISSVYSSIQSSYRFVTGHKKANAEERAGHIALDVETCFKGSLDEAMISSQVTLNLDVIEQLFSAIYKL